MNLVTGATGHIGNVLVRRLLAQGKPVRALILPNEDGHELDDLNVERVRGDVLDLPSLHRAFAGVDHVYHLAGMISILPGSDHLLERVNVQGTLNILIAALQADIYRLVYTSSIHAIQRVPAGVTIDETVPFDPLQALSSYDRSKAQATLAVLQAARQGLNAVVVCPTGVIGPYDYRRSEMGQLILDAMQKRPQFCIRGAYDFVDVRDVAEGQILACEKGKNGEHYILSGEKISIAWLIRTVQGLIGAPAKLLTIPIHLARMAAQFTPLYYRLFHIKPRFTSYSIETVLGNSDISNRKARNELGYAPRPLYQSLVDTVHWFLENRANPGRLPNNLVA